MKSHEEIHSVSSALRGVTCLRAGLCTRLEATTAFPARFPQTCTPRQRQGYGRNSFVPFVSGTALLYEFSGHGVSN